MPDTIARGTTDGVSTRVNIRPGVSILSVLRHLNYKPWFAIAEFVDNALQSFLAHRDALGAVGINKLVVTIELDPIDDGRIIIRDNAAGIYPSEYARAFRPAELPPDRTGLCEFGMGMKSAACWFSPQWSVRTTALSDPIERTVTFDIQLIIRDDIEELIVQTTPAPTSTHFTEIVLYTPYRMPQTKTVPKIKEHLAGIYRVYLRDDLLDLRFDQESLQYTEPGILHAPDYRNLTGPPIAWRKDINFDFGQGQRATGFAAIRETASTSLAGFALFRRNRLIQGSGDEAYRPEYLFGKPNSYRYQRIFGELHLEGFEVSHTKDGFRWQDHEDVFLELLKEELNKEPLPLLDQAEEHRVRPARNTWRQSAEQATDHTAATIQREVPPILANQLRTPPETQPPPVALPPAVALSNREILVDLHGRPWRIILEVTDDPSISEWITVSDRPTDPTGMRQVGVRLALAHPFVERFAGADFANIEPMLRIAAGLGLAETAARDAGVRMSSTIRRNLNDLLRNALSKP
jgi:Histidine kinase-, DNA gyrase B-, and HSP90-like ATPase